MGVKCAQALVANLSEGATQVDVPIIDTRLTPPVPPTYALSVSVASQIEGGTLVYTPASTAAAAVIERMRFTGNCAVNAAQSQWPPFKASRCLPVGS